MPTPLNSANISISSNQTIQAAISDTMVDNRRDRNGSIFAFSLDGPGVIPTDKAIEINTQIQTLNQLRNDIVDYIRLRLGDQIVDVELDKEHYELAIKQALIKYRQRAGNAVEESFVFLDLLPETQEYILPSYIDTVKAIYRRGIGSVSGTTASQFEPFASGYLNTYMLVAGRVGGLVNYELFSQYQELAMTMFGGYIQYGWNKVTKKLTITRKLPTQNREYFSVNSVTASGTTRGSTITVTLSRFRPLVAGDTVFIKDCPEAAYNGQYLVLSAQPDGSSFTIESHSDLLVDSLSAEDIALMHMHSPQIDGISESVLLHVYNTKPDSMIISDPQILPWIQDYALAFCKSILGQARGKFSSVAGPQGAGQLNGAALLQEAQQEMLALEEELKRYIDGSTPLTWVTG